MIRLHQGYFIPSPFRFYTVSNTKLSQSHPLHCVLFVTLTSNLLLLSCPCLSTPCGTSNYSRLHSPALVAPRYVSWLLSNPEIFPTRTSLSTTSALDPWEKPARDRIKVAAGVSVVVLLLLLFVLIVRDEEEEGTENKTDHVPSLDCAKHQSLSGELIPTVYVRFAGHLSRRACWTGTAGSAR